LPALSSLSRIHVAGQASRLSLTLNDRLEAEVLEVPGHSPKGERKFIRWRQARRLSYASGPTQRAMATALFRLSSLLWPRTATLRILPTRVNYPHCARWRKA
jgi:hypothetical protein